MLCRRLVPGSMRRPTQEIRTALAVVCSIGVLRRLGLPVAEVDWVN